MKEEDKDVKSLIQQIRKDYGEECILRLGDSPQKQIDVISTGSLSIDKALGVGGLPKGRIIEIYGPESSGKTTICLQTIAQAQKLGGMCAIIDTEHALDITYAKALGVDVDNTYLSQPDNGEQALNITQALVESGKFAVIVIDSIAALTPQAEIEGEMGDSTMGAQARLMSQACRKLAGPVRKSDVILIFTNQLRSKIGVMFGSPETTSGGNAMKFYASIRIDIRRTATNKEDSIAVSNHTKVTIKKNKVSVPYKIAEFDIVYGEGIDRYLEVFEEAVKKDIIKKSGAWFTIGTEKVQGKESVKDILKKDDKLFEEIYNQVK